MSIENIQAITRPAKRERAFDLSLPVRVTGMDAMGGKFAERTEICSISAEEISFWLQTKLMIGSKILLNLDVPRTIILERALRLQLSGMVVFIMSGDRLGKKQYLSALLDRGYKLELDS